MKRRDANTTHEKANIEKNSVQAIELASVEAVRTLTFSTFRIIF